MQLFSFIRLIALLLLVCNLQACEQDITNSVHINTKPSLVVTSFISPQDTVLQVKVSKSQPAIGKIYSPEELKVKDAVVKLSHGDKTVQFAYNANSSVYEAKATSLPVLAGQTYVLNVSTPDGYAATGTSTVPDSEGILISDLNHAVVQKVTEWDNQGYEEHTFSYKWQDAPGRDNYYQVVAELERKLPQFNIWERYSLFSDDSFFSDAKKDGQIFSSSGFFNHYPRMDSPGMEWVKPYFLHVYVAVTDRSYYLYHQSIKQNQEANGNPFAEPVLVYSNITGGLGIFAAYNQVKATLRVD